MTVPSHPFLLDIDNATGLAETLTITVLAGDRSTELLTRTVAPRRNDLVRLPALSPGEYFATEKSHPEFAVRLVVTP